MNITRNAILAVAAVAALFASVPRAPAQSAPPPPSRSPDEIDQIVGPIALYPDPLVSVVLPAATMPDEIQAAAQTVANGSVSAADNPSWDESVRAVAHYPDLVVWMSDNIDWTAQLGVTFATQPAEVLNSIQRLRARARAVGTLVDTPQQRVVIEGELIAIVPAQPTVIYVPRYDPAIVYINNPPRRGPSVFSFSAGFALGAWLTYDFDWRRHSLFVADRSWAEHRDWSRPSFSVAVSARENHREWRPAPNRTQVNVNISRTVVAPRLMGERTANNEPRRTDFRTDRSPGVNPTQGAVSQNQPASPPQANPTAQQPQPAAPSAQPVAPAPGSTPDRSVSVDERRNRERRDQATREREQRERTPEPNRGVVNQNPEHPTVATTPPAAAQPTTPPAPKVTPPSSSPQTGALSSNEQRRADRERSANEPQRRPTPRGSITAGSTGEFPNPAEAKEKKAPAENAPAATGRDRAMTPRPADERSQREEHRPAVVPPTPNQQPQVKTQTPASTQGVPPSVQPKQESEDEKARKQKEEDEKKKKKKPDDSNGG